MTRHPYQETAFEQEVMTFYNRHHGLEVDPVGGVAVAAEGAVWAGTALGVARFDGEKWHYAQDPQAVPGGYVSCLAAARDGALWAGCSTGVARWSEGKWTHWYGEDAPNREMRGITPDGKGGCWATMDREGDLNSRDVWHFDGGKWTYWSDVAGKGGEGLGAVAVDGKGNPYLVRSGKVITLRGRGWVRLNLGLGRAKVLTLAQAPDGSVWVGTSEGALVLENGRPVRTIGKPEGMPVRGVHAIGFAPNGDVWLSHRVAASRLRQGKWRYCSPYSWFPGGQLNAIAVAADGTLWLASENGISRVETRMMTLTEKSGLLEPLVPKNNLRHGMVLERWLMEPEVAGGLFHYVVADNDGSHIAEYCAAEAFRYGATGAEDARRNAREALSGLTRLVRLTGRRGFLARTALRKDDPLIVAIPGDWHESADGEWLWKGDTSSDELDTHMLAYGVYYDLVADEAERRELSGLVSDLIGGVVDNGYVLLDLDGKHTRWGVWAPALLMSDEWEPERKLNSLEILAHLRSALHITGETQFEEAYRELVDRHGYAEVVSQSQMATPPFLFHKYDDVLACKAYYPLLKYEADPELRAAYLDSLERFWEVVRPERNPLFTAVCNVHLGRWEDLEVIFEVMSGYRPDPVWRGWINSLRQDVEVRKVEGRVVVDNILPGAERAHYDWGTCPYDADRGDGPESVIRPTPFLLTYWMARYHGLLLPPPEGGRRV